MHFKNIALNILKFFLDYWDGFLVSFKIEMQLIDILGVRQQRSLLIELGPVFSKLKYLFPKIVQIYPILTMISYESGPKGNKLLILMNFWKLKKHFLTH